MSFDASIADRLSGVTVECNDAIKVITTYDSKDSFHYIDPPYVGTDLGHYGGYTLEDYKKLLDCLSKVKGKFLLSSFPSEILSKYTKQYGWHSMEVTQIKSAVHSKHRTKNTKKVEVLTANFHLEGGANEK